MPTKKTTTKEAEPKVKKPRAVKAEKVVVEKTAKKGFTLTGVVTSTKMQKTIVVKVTNFVKHPKYQKYLTLTKKYKVHDENGVAKMGDTVQIVETRPLSKDKHFTLVEKK
ncbi:MAG: 30S ribosomal protein S17 [bacterium]